MMNSKAIVKEGQAGRDFLNIGSIIQNLPSGPVKFTIERAVEVTAECVQTTKELFVGDDRLVEGALADLEQHRILLLAGEPGCGTSTMAIYLSTVLPHRQSTLVVTPLEPEVEIDLWEIDVVRRTMILVDAFSRRNRDLAGFFSRHDGAEWERLTGKLRENEAYLIFTAVPENVGAFRAVRRDVPLPSRDLVGRGLDLRLQWLERRGQRTAQHILQLTVNRERLIDDLKTLPRVARFLDQYVTGDPDLDAALLRFNDVPFWFSNQLAGDVDAWCFALTLALAQVVRNGSSAGWYELDRIRRAVTEQIRAGRRAGQSLSDDSLLLRARAEVSGEPSRLGDAVRFIDRSYPATIWQTLATRHRRVLTALIPTLRAIAEQERGPGSYAVRSLAAQMLGRIGELDPFSISIPLVRQDWTGVQRPLIGRLLQGMRASGNRAYRQAALGAVDSLTADTRNEPEDHERLLAAISAYALLGERELVLAMNKLGAIAVQKLAPVMTNLHQVKRVAEEVGQHLSGTASQETAEDLLQHRARLDSLAERLSEEQTALLGAIEQAIVYLCLTNDPIDVLDAMREWIACGGAETGTLVALLYLHDGIADELDAVAASVQALSGTEHAHPLARSLRNSAGAAEKLAAFLSDLRTSIDQSTALPAELRRELQERLGQRHPEGEPS